MIIKDPTTPQTRRYTTLWNAEVRKTSENLKQMCCLTIKFNLKYQCRTAVLHCCKGDTESQWEMAIFGMSELRNPWTDWLRIWHMWLFRWVDLDRMPNFIKFGGTRASRQNGEMCNSRTSFIFFYRRFLGKLYRKKYSTISSA